MRPQNKTFCDLLRSTRQFIKDSNISEEEKEEYYKKIEEHDLILNRLLEEKLDMTKSNLKVVPKNFNPNGEIEIGVSKIFKTMTFLTPGEKYKFFEKTLDTYTTTLKKEYSEYAVQLLTYRGFADTAPLDHPFLGVFPRWANKRDRYLRDKEDQYHEAKITFKKHHKIKTVIEGYVDEAVAKGIIEKEKADAEKRRKVEEAKMAKKAAKVKKKGGRGK